MANTSEIHWLAGFLEGEGSFTTNRLKTRCIPTISASSNDKDVAQRAARIMGAHVYGPYEHKTRAGKNPHWQLRTQSTNAIGWMMTLYSLMGQRRKGQIKRALDNWRQIKPTLSSITRNRNGFSTISQVR